MSKQNKPARGPGRPSAVADPGTRAALLAAARELFVERGYPSTSVRQIAARAGVNPAMIRYYFRDKAGLYETMIRDTIGPALQELSDLSEDAAGERDPLRTFVRRYMGILGQNPWLPRLIVSEVLMPGGRLRDMFVREIAGRAASLLPRILAQQQSAGRVCPRLDPVATTLSIASFCVFPFLAAPVLGPVLELPGNDQRLQEVIEHTADLLFNGISPSKQGAGA